MSSCSAALPTEVGCLNHHNALPDDASVSKNSECPSEHKQDEEQDEEEEEDVDFNPFLKETSSQEASSSLSSEIEGLDAGVVESGGNNSAALATTLLSKAANQEEDYGVGDSEHGEEIVMQTTVSSGGAGKIGSEKTLPTGLLDGKSVLISQPENETFREKAYGSSSGIDVVNDVIFGELSSMSHSRKLAMDIDDEDAICRRTRARYSLASFTLDELETFLQETDDEDDLQNVDDEEEYRKFLAAVLEGGDGDHQLEEKTGNIDDEDEDNDADFELEIEEALESDVDENIRGENQEQENEAIGRRPETRQNRRQKVSVRYKKKISGKLNRPLRPLLPSAPIAPFPALDGNKIILESAPHCLFSSVHNGFLNGFTPHQIGQLHCLIHEHVQLLIQVFSLCVLEPSREHIASQVQGLILEMLHKRDQALVWRRIPYPSFYFCPPYIHPSVPDELPKNLPAQSTIDSSSAFDAQSDCSLGNNMVTPSNNNFPSKDRYGHGSSGQVGHFQTTEGSLWVPFVSGPVLSVTDVAPLNLVGNYIDDVSTAVREYQRGYIGGSCDTRFEREPLFPFQSFQSSTEVIGEVPRGIVPPVSKLARSSGSDQTPRKTMAATLVERTKKQSVAPVPKKIAKLAQRFFPLFNPGLYPHKPPPASVANRLLFTEAEDQLLAMGLMECNTDWKAIQQRFLPCKSKHQIFVRQKNRSSSKAPENPIKAVRRMKNSPLTAEEKARIEEGLKFYKLDWMSVWNFVVPYRDPSLLPRQWRVATGTQKSYKTDADKKEKRRLYELKRRLSKPAALARREDCSTDNAGGENNSGDDCIDNEDEAYVHEAFLADWRPSTSGVPLEIPVSNFGETPPSTYFLSQESSNVGARINNSGPRDLQPQIHHQFPASLKHSQHLHTPSHVSLTSFKSQVCMRPYRARRTNRARLVKLAPDLPPVNLPPSVRVMSQSAFKSYQGGSANQNIVPKRPCAANVGHIHPLKAGQLNSNPGKSGTVHLQPQDSGVGDKFVAEEKDESDLQMHPLLFQAPEDGRLPYYPLNCSTSASSSFNFFSRNQPQLNLSPFHNHQKANQTLNFFDKSLKSKERSSSSLGIDFHPLLQRTDDVNSDSVTAHSAAHRSANSEFLRDRLAQLQNPIDPVLTKSRINSSSVATSSIPSSPSAKTNDLDLEMHLSFTSRKEKPGETRDLTEHNMTRSTVSAQDSGTIGTEHTMDSVYRPSECTPAASNSGAHALVICSNDVNRVRVNNIGDQSLPEIVMEQEELSDSEEEIGEHVEFECEEMADSEGEEGSDPEQIGNIRNKEVPNAAMEKISIDADFDDQQHEPRPHDNSKSNAGGSSESSRFRLGITDQERDNQSSSLYLNLNSCPPGSPLMKPMDSAGNNRAISRFSRSCKNTTPSAHVTPQKDQQSNLDSLAVTPLRKPRKRAQRTDSNLRTGRARKIDASSNTGATVEISDPVSTNEFG